MGWECELCKEEFNYYDEIIMLCGNIVVDDEEHGGSGDIDTIISVDCYIDSVKE